MKKKLKPAGKKVVSGREITRRVIRCFAAAVLPLLALGFPLSGVFAQQNEDSVAAILNHYAARNFIAGTIPLPDLDRIIEAGIRAPSARNGQPWHFTVVQNQNMAGRLVPNIVEGNVLIVVSARGDGKTNGAEILDCALAVQSVYLAAQALGYGSRIYTGPMDNLNKNLKSSLGLPSGHSAVALVRVGKVSGADAATAASRRKSAEDMVTYK